MVAEGKIVLDSVGRDIGVNGIEGLMTVVSKTKTTTQRDRSMCWESEGVAHRLTEVETNSMQSSRRRQL